MEILNYEFYEVGKKNISPKKRKKFCAFIVCVYIQREKSGLFSGVRMSRSIQQSFVMLRNVQIPHLHLLTQGITIPNASSSVLTNWRTRTVESLRNWSYWELTITGSKDFQLRYQLRLIQSPPGMRITFNCRL